MLQAGCYHQNVLGFALTIGFVLALLLRGTPRFALLAGRKLLPFEDSRHETDADALKTRFSPGTSGSCDKANIRSRLTCINLMLEIPKISHITACPTEATMLLAILFAQNNFADTYQEDLLTLPNEALPTYKRWPRFGGAKLFLH